MGKRMATDPQECEVTVRDSAGEPWTLTVRVGSLYAAVFGYSAEQICGRHRDYPKLNRDTDIEARLPDGRVFKTTFGRASEWANRRRYN
jgi:hypothetical protein